MEVDSQILLSLVFGRDVNLDPYSAIIQDVQQLRYTEWEVTFSHASRQANQAADVLPTKGFMSQEKPIVYYRAHGFLMNHLYKNYSGIGDFRSWH